MQLTDTHVHLYSKEFDNDREAVINRAVQAGVDRFFLPNIDSDSISTMLSLAKQHPGNFFSMMGLHPCSVDEKYEQELTVVEYWLEKQNSDSSSPLRFYAVGEIGIDLYWDKTFFRQQQEALRRQIGLAKKYSLPIVIHMRNSFEEVYEIVSEMNDEMLGGIFHCFSGNREQAERILGLGGFKLGIGGVVTFKNSGLDQVVANIGLEHIVLETDAPYLAPVPHRGKRNESSYIRLIAEKVAEVTNTSLEEVAQVTTDNSKKIFGV